MTRLAKIGSNTRDRLPLDNRSHIIENQFVDRYGQWQIGLPGYSHADQAAHAGADPIQGCERGLLLQMRQQDQHVSSVLRNLIRHGVL